LAVKIRLSRRGAKKRPFYRVVVADSRSARDGRVIDTIGFYNPISKTEPFRIDGERALHWLNEGAELTDTARSVLRRAGVMKAWREGTPVPVAGTGEAAQVAEAPPAAEESAQPEAETESPEGGAE
jgi:small subunit ribosomal protein S16